MRCVKVSNYQIHTPILTFWDAQRLLMILRNSEEYTYTSYFNFRIEIYKDIVKIGNYTCIERSYFLECLEDYIDRESDETCKSLIYIDRDGIYRTVFWKDNFYKLCQVYENWAPTLIINGIVMHTLQRDPIEDAKMKVLYVKKGDKVLDTCACLGYTASAALDRGASYILSVEIDSQVLQISRLNPYSTFLKNYKVDIVNASILDIVEIIDDEYFNYILHDPPRLMSTTGDLYSLELYKEFRRILKRGGILFHYTGATGSKYRGLNVMKGVIKRLKEAGFQIIKTIEGFGLYARKI